jgi:hypothetical protein
MTRKHMINILSLVYARCAVRAHKISVFQEMAGKCSELDNWRVFHMTLCVVCFIVWIVRRL